MKKERFNLFDFVFQEI
jgi:hypothetical protein